MPQPSPGISVDSRYAAHPLYGGAQDLVLGDVDGELVVPDLQRPRLAAVAVHLVDLAQPAPQYRRRLVHGPVVLHQPLPECPLGLPPQRVGQHRHQVRRLAEHQVLVTPPPSGQRVADEEQQPVDAHLRGDAHLHVADPGGADVPSGLHAPPSVRRARPHVDDAGAGERLGLPCRQRDLDARTGLGQRHHGHGCSVPTSPASAAVSTARLARSAARPYRSATSTPSP